MMEEEPGVTDIDPLVSIVIPVYNDAKTLERAVESCLDQSYGSIEVVIVDDCSTDDTPELADKLAADRGNVQVIHHTENLKPFESRRDGVKRASGDYLLFLDADDRLDPDVCRECVALALQTDADIVNFAIVPESDDPAFDRSGYEQLFAACDGMFEGPDIVHAIFRDGLINWSLCGKLFSARVARDGYGDLPRQAIYLNDDLTALFAIALRAARLVSGSGLPRYHYSMGSGGTRAGSTGITADEFEPFTKGVIAADTVDALLDAAGADARKAFEDDYRAMRRKQIADPAYRLFNQVPEGERGEAFRRFVSAWPAAEVADILCDVWNGDAGAPLRSLDEAGAFSAEPNPSRNIAILVSGDAAQSDTRRIASELGVPLSQAVVLPRIQAEAEADVPYASSARAAERRKRNKAIVDAVDSCDAGTVVIANWCDEALLGDILAAKVLGAYVVVLADERIADAVARRGGTAYLLTPNVRFSDAVICADDGDALFWETINARVVATGGAMSAVQVLSKLASGTAGLPCSGVPSMEAQSHVARLLAFHHDQAQAEKAHAADESRRADEATARAEALSAKLEKAESSGNTGKRRGFRLRR
jgi:hypothetical protein